MAGALPWIAAGGYELGRRALSSPLFWNLLQGVLYAEQEVEIHELMKQMNAMRESAGSQEQIPGAPAGCVWPPRVGSGEWYNMLDELENELAAGPVRNGCDCEEW